MSGESIGDRAKRRAMQTGSPIPPRNDGAFEAHLARTSAEAHEAMAMKLWRGASDLGRIVAAVEMMGNHLWDAIPLEGDNADKVVIEGPEIIRALRCIAMRLDRAVMVKAGKDD